MDSWKEYFAKVLKDAALAASPFHFDELRIREVKAYLHRKGIAIDRASLQTMRVVVRWGIGLSA